MHQIRYLECRKKNAGAVSVLKEKKYIFPLTNHLLFYIIETMFN